jgi:protein dopey
MFHEWYAQPTLLNLYDTHYLPLQEGLRPVMKGFILALLPGLEEETGEFFDKVSSELDPRLFCVLTRLPRF